MRTNGTWRWAQRFFALLVWIGPVAIATSPAAARDPGPQVPAYPSGLSFWEVDREELRLSLVPLRLPELEAAAEAWIEALREQVMLLAQLQVAIARSGSDEERVGLRSQFDRIRPRAVALVPLVESVLNELEQKGGDAAAGRRYLSRVVAAAGLADAAPDGGAEPSGESEPARAAEPWDEPIIGLRRRLLPMQRAELEREAETWLARVQDRVERMVEAESRGESSTGEEQARSIREAESYRQQRGLLIERALVVLSALESKGGSAEEIQRQRQYLSAAGEQPALQWYNPRALLIQSLAWMTSPRGGIAMGIKLAQAVGILVVFWFLAKIAARAARTATGRLKRASGLLKDFVVGGVKKVVLLIGLIVAVATFGVNITPLVAALGAAGLVIGLALQGTLSNFASGLLILFYRPFDVGDIVEAGGVIGRVEAMTLVSTVIVTFDNQQMILPNNSVWNGVITNVTGRPTRRVDLTVGVDYRSDLDRVQKILEEMVRSHPKVLADPAPVVKLNEYADSAINFIVRPWARTSDYWDVYWDLQAQVKRRFDAEGISIPYPQHDINFVGPVEIISREA